MKLRYLPILFAAVLCARAAFAKPSTGILVNELPSPSSDGAYEIGNASFTTSGFNSQNMTGIGYIDWAALKTAGLPDDATVRLLGGVALYQIPEGITLDLTKVTHVAMLDSTFLEYQEYAIPTGLNVLNMPVSKIAKASEDAGATVTFTVSDKAISHALVNNGAWAIGKDNGLTSTGGLTGSGSFTLAGFSMGMYVTGSLQFDGSVNFGSSQNGQQLFITSPDATAKLGTFYSNNYGGAGGTAQQLVYNPLRGVDDPPCTLQIGSLNPNEVGGLEPTKKYYRWGCQLCAYSNNTIATASPVRRGPIGLVAYKTSHYSLANAPKFDLGFGNFIIGGTSVANCSPIFNVTPNCNVTFRKKTIMYTASTITVNYAAESNVVNRGTLNTAQMENTKPSVFTVKGYNPWNLPRTITTGSSMCGRTTVTVLNDAWTMPFDFGATADEVNVARCETDCAISIPASGTVTVTNITTAVDATYPTKWTEYPILTCNAGGETAFADWTVDFTGTWPEDVQYEKVVKETGLYVRIRKPRGAVILLNSK